ncbi:MAG: VWA domain-containing protein [Acidobacteriaceae bacterium]
MVTWRAWVQVSAIGLALLVATRLPAQSPSQTPHYKVSTHLVQFGVIARNKEGVSGNLTKNDFVILDRGKPRTISVFEADAVGHTPLAAALPPNTFSDEPRYNGEAPRTVTIILLDNLNTLSGSGLQPFGEAPMWVEDHALGMAKEHLLTFLGQMDPRDRVAIYGLTDQVRVLCDFTCNRDQLLAAVRAYDVRSHTAQDSVDPPNIRLPNVPPEFNEAIDQDMRSLAEMHTEDRAALTMAALTSITAHVADLPVRKNLLWLTADLPVSGAAIAAVLARGNIVAYPIDARGLLPKTGAIDIADANPFKNGNVAVELGHAAVPMGQGAMTDMAADTGGRAFLNTNNLTDAIRQVVENSAATYTLGFYLPEKEVDGKFHRITVKTKMPGITLTYPRGYFAIGDAAVSENDRRNAFLAAIRSPLDATAVPVDVRLARAEQPPHSLQIVGVAGIGDVFFQQQDDLRTGALEIYAIQQDAAGNVLNQMNQRLDLKLNEQQYEQYLRSGILFRNLVTLKSGATVLRVLVQDPHSAEVGCVIVPLDSVN